MEIQGEEIGKNDISGKFEVISTYKWYLYVTLIYNQDKLHFWTDSNHLKVYADFSATHLGNPTGWETIVMNRKNWVAPSFIIDEEGLINL